MRRQPRIAYQSQIRLKGPGHELSVPALVHNLALGGAFITTATDATLGPGIEVTCRFTFGSQELFVGGQIAWTRTLAGGATSGVGIEFRELNDQDRAVLEQIAAPAARGQAFDVWFDQSSTPLRGEGVPGDRSTRLVAPLPFLRAASPVRLAFADEAGSAPREGVVQAAVMDTCDEEGVPQAWFKVSLAVLDRAGGTIEVKAPVRATLEMIPLVSTMVDPTLTDPQPPRWLRFDEPLPDGPLMLAGRSARRRPWSAPRGWWPIVVGALVGAALVGALLLIISGRARL